MVRDHPKTLVRAGIVAIGDTGEVGPPADDRLEFVDLPIALVSLRDRREALETHSGIDRRAWQVALFDFAVFFVALVLHEDEVPDFHEATGIFAVAPRIGLVVGDKV